MDYMHARYYSPNLGRFLSVDPVGGSVGSSQSWNRYSYVLNNPIAAIDPNGEETKFIQGLKVEHNVFGHAALAINDQVFSYPLQWGVPLEKYMGAEDAKRESISYTLDISPEQEQALLDYLVENNPHEVDGSSYDETKNNCVQVSEKALEKTGILPQNKSRVVGLSGNIIEYPKDSQTPESLADQIKGAGLVKSTETSGKSKVSAPNAIVGTIKSIWNYFTRD